MYIYVIVRVCAQLFAAAFVLFISSPRSFTRHAIGDYFNAGYIEIIPEDRGVFRQIKHFILGEQHYAWRGNNVERLRIICSELRNRKSGDDFLMAPNIQLAYYRKLNTCVVNPELSIDEQGKENDPRTYECEDTIDGESVKTLRSPSVHVKFFEPESNRMRQRLFEKKLSCLIHTQMEL